MGKLVTWHTERSWERGRERESVRERRERETEREMRKEIIQYKLSLFLFLPEITCSENMDTAVETGVHPCQCPELCE